jgi:dihydrofolate synthase / folylpolyglutamate synthase
VNAQHYLRSLELHGIKLGLENIRQLLEAAGDPHTNLPTVHVAGTNGKGSVIATLDAILRAAGYRVGRFTSPHLIRVNERFLIDGVPISDTDLENTVAAVRQAAAGIDRTPTYFEAVTAVAFQWLHAQQVDIALIEVGMGGRFDATNLIEPLVTAITTIDLDHTAYLGETLEKIAFEKAGILKPGIPAVVAESKAGPLEVILACAAELSCPVLQIGRDFHYTVSGPPFDQQFAYRSSGVSLETTPLALAGAHQGENAATAVALAEILSHHYPRLSAPEVIAAGLASVRWPCRLDRVLDHPPVIVDVSHNPAGALRLAAQLKESVVVMAVSSDKDAAGMLRNIAPIAHRLILTQFQGKRSLPAEQLSALAGDLPHECAASLHEAIGRGMALASEDRPLVITGSIFTAGEARTILSDSYGAPPLCF